MESKIVGELNSVEFDDDLFESSPCPIRYFDNKELKIVFLEPKHEYYLEKADSALKNFLELKRDNRFQDSHLVYNYYTDILKFGYTKPLDIEKIEDIWNFVYPSEIIIEWDENNDFFVCISCGCKWEEEHGLQLVFKDGRTLTRASGHDGSLTD